MKTVPVLGIILPGAKSTAMTFTTNPVGAIRFCVFLMVEDSKEVDFQQQLELEFYLRISFENCFYLERERERNIHLSVPSWIYSLIDSCMSPDGNQTLNLGISGQHSNQLSYPARTGNFYFLNLFF